MARSYFCDHCQHAMAKGGRQASDTGGANEKERQMTTKPKTRKATLAISNLTP
jgi:hypothetical protein